MDNFSGENWKQFFTVGSHRVQTGIGHRDGFTLYRKTDGMPIAKAMYDYKTAIDLAKKLTVKLETRLEKILLG